jgi:hypothetical protein
LGIYNDDTVADLTEYHTQYVLHKDLGPTRHESLAPMDVLKSPMLGWKEKASLAKLLPAIALLVPKNDPRDITSAAHLDTESAYDYIKGFSPNFADYILEPSMQAFCGYEKDDYSKAWLVWLMAGFAWAGNWWSFKERGVGQLSQAFEENFKLDPNVDLRLNAKVSRLDTRDDGVAVQFVQDGVTHTVEADFTVVAVPTPLVPSFMFIHGLRHRSKVQVQVQVQVQVRPLRPNAHSFPSGVPTRKRQTGTPIQQYSVLALQSWIEGDALRIVPGTCS